MGHFHLFCRAANDCLEAEQMERSVRSKVICELHLSSLLTPHGLRGRRAVSAHLSCSCETPVHSRFGRSSHRCHTGICTRRPPGQRTARQRRTREPTRPERPPWWAVLATCRCVCFTFFSTTPTQFRHMKNFPSSRPTAQESSPPSAASTPAPAPAALPPGRATRPLRLPTLSSLPSTTVQATACVSSQPGREPTVPPTSFLLCL